MLAKEGFVLSDSEFTELVQTYGDMVFRVALGYMRNQADAEDVAQSVFLSLYHTDKEFEGSFHIKHWLVRATYNECTSLYRALRRSPENIDDYIESLAQPQQEEAGLLGEILKLPKKYAAVLYLYYYEGYSTEELAGLLKVPAATVRTRLSRGRK